MAKPWQIEEIQGLYEMGRRYLYGFAVNRDIVRGLNYCHQAAEKGHAGACYELAQFYQRGETSSGVDPDLVKADYYANLPKVENVKFEYNTPDYDQQEYKILLESFRKKFSDSREIQGASPHKP